MNIVTSNSTLNGVPEHGPPDVTGPIEIIGEVDQWFDPSVFVPSIASATWEECRHRTGLPHTDLSLIKMPGPARSGCSWIDVFDVFNHPNFGPPGTIVGSPTFGKITRTRLPTGEAGSSRRIQLAARMSF